MRTSEQINDIAAALAAAQAKIESPKRNKTVKAGAYGYSYATFDHLIECVRRPLAENGIWWVQSITNVVSADGQARTPSMLTRLVHASGQWIESGIPMPQLAQKPQEAGSQLTYFRRYSLSAALGLAAEEDDDGQSAQRGALERRPSSQEMNRRNAKEQEAAYGGRIATKGLRPEHLDPVPGPPRGPQDTITHPETAKVLQKPPNVPELGGDKITSRQLIALRKESYAAGIPDDTALLEMAREQLKFNVKRMDDLTVGQGRQVILLIREHAKEIAP